MSVSVNQSSPPSRFYSCSQIVDPQGLILNATFGDSGVERLHSRLAIRSHDYSDRSIVFY